MRFRSRVNGYDRATLKRQKDNRWISQSVKDRQHQPRAVIVGIIYNFESRDLFYAICICPWASHVEEPFYDDHDHLGTGLGTKG